MGRKLKLEELGRISVDAFKSAEKRPLVVVLDNVRSMHNVGAILRTSDAFLIQKVYLSGITPAPPHREIRKTAIGAEESVDWEKVDDTVVLVQQLIADGYEILPLEQTEDSISLSDYVPQGKAIALVVGHEVNGVQQEIIDLAEKTLEIPQFGTKHSLNVSVAAGISLYNLSQFFS
ncbi:MAG: RNA methyltransferase [Bacteroidota bacterium]